MLKNFINELIQKPDKHEGRVVKVRLDKSHARPRVGHIVLTKYGPGIIISTEEGLQGDRYAVKFGSRVRYLKSEALYVYYVWCNALNTLLFLNPNNYYYIAQPRQRVEFYISRKGYASLTTEYKVDYNHYKEIQKLTNGGVLLRRLREYRLIK